MRPVSGFERPALQWIFVSLGAALVLVAGVEAIGLRRAHSLAETRRAADLNARLERQQLETRLAREQSAREAFSLEAGRLRGRASAPGAPDPTLTLQRTVARAPTPPDPTVDPPAPSQVIQLRLPLPAGHARAEQRYAIALRSWTGGAVLWSRGDLTASTIDGRAMVTARLTGDVLAPGAYEIALTEVTPGAPPADVAFYEVAVRPPVR